MFYLIEERALHNVDFFRLNLQIIGLQEYHNMMIKLFFNWFSDELFLVLKNIFYSATQAVKAQELIEYL